MAGALKQTRTRKTAFTVPVIEKLKPESRRYEISEPSGLRVAVGKRGKVFFYRFRSPTTGKARKLTLGRFPGKSLADARIDVINAQQAVKDGRDPQAERHLAQQNNREVPIVRDLVEEYLASLPDDMRTPEQVASYLQNVVVPEWGDVRASSITRANVKALVDAKREVAARSASRLLGYIKRMFVFAIDEEYLTENPAATINIPSGTKARERFLSRSEIKYFWEAVPSMNSKPQVPLMLKLSLVTGQRIGEITKARWEHISGRWWKIPIGSAKSKKDHRVFLADLAMDLIEAARQVAGDSEYIFPGQTGGQMSPESPRHALDRSRDKIKIDDFSIHVLRKTCGTELGSARVPEEIVSRILSHAKKGVTEKHYNFYRYDDEKAAAMTLWSRRLSMIITGKLTDSSVTTQKAEKLERKWMRNPADGRPVLEAIASALEVGEMPPAWATDAFVQGMQERSGGGIIGKALKVENEAAGGK